MLSTPGIRAWGDMPATDSDTRHEKNGVVGTENGLTGLSDTDSRPRTGAANGARVKDRARLGLEKVFWFLKGC